MAPQHFERDHAANPCRYFRQHGWCACAFQYNDLKALPSSPSPRSPVYRDCCLIGFEPQLRLLKLLPGRWNDPLECNLDHYALVSAPPYQALSYAWGKPDPLPYGLRVNNRQIEIQMNLFDALKYIRHKEKPQLLWVDALCIDQHNNDEKNQQVAQMGGVYTRADKVIAWLGVPKDSSSSVMAKLAEETLEPPDTHFIQGLREFCSRSYWTRVWVVQELALAKQVVFKCGHEEVDGDVFQRSLGRISRSFNHTLAPEDPFRKALHLVSLVWIYRVVPHDEDTLKALYTLKRAALLEASDPLDKIYGLLQILPEYFRQHFSLDYDVPFWKLLKTVVEAQLVRDPTQNRRPTLDTLCEFPPIRKRANSWWYPSWLPDIGATWNDMDKVDCKAGRVDAEATINNLVLAARGRKLTEITSVLGPLEYRQNVLEKTFRSRKRFLDYKVSFTLIKETAMDLSIRYPRNFSSRPENDLFTLLGRAHPESRCKVPPEQLWNAAMEAERDGTLTRFRDSAPDFEYMFVRLKNRSFFTTREGQMGLGPTDLKEGDLVCILYGCRMPVALRKLDGNVDGNDYYIFVGPLCTHDILSDSDLRGAGTQEKFWIR